jgi:uncharacterized protein DUF1905/bacteriocin resistance YdeI/OmpD-like protein
VALMPAVNERGAGPPIQFEAVLRMLDKSTILQLPKDASAGLPSRGQVSVRGTINGHEFETVLEPDGSAGHWMRIDGKLQRAAEVRAGDAARFEIQATKQWPEPALPKDFEKALAAAPARIHAVWKDITPMARWEWVRWINATNNPDTRKRRVEVSISKMNSGKRRPYCFNLAACTDPELSQNGLLRKVVGPGD